MIWWAHLMQSAIDVITFTLLVAAADAITFSSDRQPGLLWTLPLCPGSLCGMAAHFGSAISTACMLCWLATLHTLLLLELAFDLSLWLRYTVHKRLHPSCITAHGTVFCSVPIILTPVTLPPWTVRRSVAPIAAGVAGTF